jgi:hypothetical protein
MTTTPPRSFPRAALALTLLAWACAATAHGAATHLVVRSGRGTAGKEIEVPVDVRSPAGLGALEVEVVYDPEVLELKDVGEGPLLADAMLGHKLLVPGRVRCDLISAKPIDSDGSLFVVRFQAKGAKGQTQIALVNAQAWDHADILEMRVAVEAGLLALEESSFAAARLPWAWIGVAAAAVVVVLLAFLLGRGSAGRQKRP